MVIFWVFRACDVAQSRSAGVTRAHVDQFRGISSNSRVLSPPPPEFSRCKCDVRGEGDPQVLYSRLIYRVPEIREIPKTPLYETG